MTTLLSLRAGVVDDIESEDDAKDYEPEQANHRLGVLLVRMVRQADARIPAERRARRTLQEMLPGYQRQPVLVLHRPEMNDACPLCGVWSCRGNCKPYPGNAQAGASATAAVR
ncbi:hypothetical protein [Streptomyces sp. V1I6]|uniref:hypothetical protein n=1 Tax=Streptomyces sp. V1I6 TaxID=3042273 RepID=UPI00278B5D09|nr:hypothetical protein [Streptomyces sp. V1I6]MDQ0847577.1 hypothetical protein [Streptomyces sp. V1I6]